MKETERLEEFIDSLQFYHEGKAERDWAGSDSKKRWDMNYPNHPELEPYINNPIHYNLQKNSIRCEYPLDSLEDRDVDLYLGCSHTFGTGHHWENTWPYHVAKATGNIPVNLGIGGGSVGGSYLRLLKYLPKFKVKNIFHYQLSYARFYYFIGRRVQNFQLWNTVDELRKKFGDDYVQDNFMTDGITDLYLKMYTNLIEYEAIQLGIPYYFSSHPLKEFNINKEDDLVARDLIHPSKNTMKAIANIFINKLNND